MISTVKDLFTRAFAAAGMDNAGMLAAGVAYYCFLALVPLLAVAVLSYGLFVDPETVARHINALADMLPSSAAQLVGGQIEGVVESSAGKKGAGLAIALGVALFGARNAAGSIVTAISIAMRRPNDRSLVRSNLVAVAVTLGGVLGAGLTALATAIMAALGALIPEAGGAGLVAGKALTYAALCTVAIVGNAVLYRFAPHGRRPGWRAVRPGAIFAGVGFMLLTLGFGIYVANFTNYNATYGALASVIILLTWLYLVAYVLIFGAELNAVASDPTLGGKSVVA